MKSRLIYGFQIAYTFLSWLFVVGVLYQVYITGLAVVAKTSGWDAHGDLGHGLGLPLILMLITAYAGRLPRRLKWFTWLLFLVYVIQADVLLMLRSQVPMASAFHPVLALVDFALGWWLARQAWQLVRSPAEESKTPSRLSVQT
jgi:hypothetical protein